MGLITEKITYNVRDRGRKFTGVDRNLDTVSLARIINSPATQERVKHGDMVGYYGHWARIKFGSAPQETIILDGKVVPIPVALRTVFLSADDDGNITHQEEFADTEEGRIAQGMYESKMGGFSTVIDPVPNTMPIVAKQYWGCDFVISPNYSTNRGHKVLLDGVVHEGEDHGEFMAILDAAIAEEKAAASHFLMLLDATSAQLALALEALERAAKENDLLVGRLAAGGGDAMLDDILGTGDRPFQGNRSLDFGRFSQRPLVSLQNIDPPKKPAQDNGLMHRLGL